MEVLEDRLAPAGLPDGFVDTQYAFVDDPISMEFAPDGRLFVAEKSGSLRVIKNDELLPDPFLTLDVDTTGERGLLSIAFDPDFVSNSFVYVSHNVAVPDPHIRVSRFTADGDVADPASEVVLMDLDPLLSYIHNGGLIHFGPDDKLYIANGDSDRSALAQSLGSFYGKILRINPDPENLIPDDNPFIDETSGLYQAIWALGLRNPFKFNFQPETGRMFINDVGHLKWEEINEGVAGGNYGWPTKEGPSNNPDFVSPIFAYDHGETEETGCAITGGAFYNPSNVQFPETYVGKYFFTDYCSGWIRALDLSDNTASPFAQSAPRIAVDLQVGPDGGLYYLSRNLDEFSSGLGAVRRIQYSVDQPPAITIQPGSQTIPAGRPVTFMVEAGGTPPFTYQWQRDGVDIPDATSDSFTIPAVAEDDNGGEFRVIITNEFGSATSEPALLTVTENHEPTATITSPLETLLYQGGQLIEFAGTGWDTEDGELTAEAFTWTVDFHHHEHVHPFMEELAGTTAGSFTVPTVNETETDVWYRIRLTVTDSDGFTHSTFRDILPLTSSIIIESNIPSMVLTLDGQPFVGPLNVGGVVGIERTIGAAGQEIAGITYEFVGWSDAGEETHIISTPSEETAYTAQFQVNCTEATNRCFLAHAYLDVMLRPVDETGLATFLDFLADGGSREDVVRELTSSPEYRAMVVNGLYQRYLDRLADAHGLVNNIKRLGEGMTIQTMSARIASSPEYFFLNGATNEGYVSALYSDVLKRAPSNYEFSRYAAALNRKSLSYRGMADRLLKSTEYRVMLVNELFAQVLRRAPASDEVRSAFRLLRRGDAMEIIAVLVGSEEYLQSTIV